jgi:hypothetical protein
MVCFESFRRADMRAAACRHFFCRDCWLGYMRNAISSGPSCLDLRCPALDCKACVSGGLAGAGPRRAAHCPGSCPTPQQLRRVPSY